MLYPQQNDYRNKLDLSGIWDFKIDQEHVGEQEGWPGGLENSRPIAVPSSWNEQYEDLATYIDLAWYVTRTYVAQSWQGQRVFIRVGSANYHGTVYVNGTKVGEHEGGHLPFAFEISNQIRWNAENVIAISVENELKPTRVPPGNVNPAFGLMNSTLRASGDFFPFAGIHRPVVLYSVPQTYIEDITVVTVIDGSDGLVTVTARLSEPAAAEGRVTLSGGAEPIAASLSFKQGTAEARLRVPAARLWSDTDPYLYQLTLSTPDDRYSLAVGIRTVAVEGGVILLNGKPVKMNGFGRHEDFIASGKGLNLPLLVKDYGLMRWTGANSYRTAHYPYSEEEMQLADREGFLIIDEMPTVGLLFENEENAAARLRVCLRLLDELVARDKNHPSVLMWSVANEPQPLGWNVVNVDNSSPSMDVAVARGQEFLDTLLRRARELDPTRLATLVTMTGTPPGWTRECDVVCINRYWGWYVLGGNLQQALAGLEEELDSLWDTWHRPVIVTEFGADTMAGMHGLPPVMWTEEYQAELVRGYLQVAARKPYVAGMQVWNFADFAAIQGVMRVGGLNMKGVFTRTRTPKMAAHVLREIWAGKREAPAAEAAPELAAAK